MKTGVNEGEVKWENDSDCFEFHERAMPVFLIFLDVGLLGVSMGSIAKSESPRVLALQILVSREEVIQCRFSITMLRARCWL